MEFSSEKVRNAKNKEHQLNQGLHSHPLTNLTADLQQVSFTDSPATSFATMTHSILGIIPANRYCCYPHSADNNTEAQMLKTLPRIIKVLSHNPGFKLEPFEHRMLPLTTKWVFIWSSGFQLLHPCSQRF